MLTFLLFFYSDSKSVTSIFMTSDQYCESQYPTVDIYGNFWWGIIAWNFWLFYTRLVCQLSKLY